MATVLGQSGATSVGELSEATTVGGQSQLIMYIVSLLCCKLLQI